MKYLMDVHTLPNGYCYKVKDEGFGFASFSIYRSRWWWLDKKIFSQSAWLSAKEARDREFLVGSLNRLHDNWQRAQKRPQIFGTYV